MTELCETGATAVSRTKALLKLRIVCDSKRIDIFSTAYDFNCMRAVQKRWSKGNFHFNANYLIIAWWQNVWSAVPPDICDQYHLFHDQHGFQRIKKSLYGFISYYNILNSQGRGGLDGWAPASWSRYPGFKCRLPWMFVLIFILSRWCGLITWTALKIIMKLKHSHWNQRLCGCLIFRTSLLLNDFVGVWHVRVF